MSLGGYLLLSEGYDLAVDVVIAIVAAVVGAFLVKLLHRLKGPDSLPESDGPPRLPGS